MPATGLPSMRPGRARPGCPARVEARRAEGAHPSMRPGRARPGCRDPHLRIRAVAAHPSMRPGRARPGCLGLRWLNAIERQTFNEAGARAPRMPRSPRRSACCGATFNEAGARAPRMPAHHRGERGHRHDPSMRPGRARPGCLRSRRRWCAAPDRPFNEAGARAPRMPGIPAPGTASSPAFNEAGARAPRMHCVCYGSIICTIQPSMRPGRARPGCTDYLENRN